MKETFSPLPDGVARTFQSAGDLMIGDALGGHQNDAGSLNCSLRGGPLAHGLFKVLSLLIS
ncbi:MAG: hypothetical protein R6V19_11960 [Armatimonadota bacterium]